MNQLLAQTRETYESKGVDFHQLFSWHTCHGFILILPDSLAMGYYCLQAEPSRATLCKDADCVYYTYAAGNMRAICQPFVDRFNKAAFTREFKGNTKTKIYSIKDIYLKLK